MIRGTPVLIGNDDTIYIYHRGGVEGSDRTKFYSPASNHLCVKLMSANKITLLNGDEFNPTSMIDLDWRQIIPPDKRVDDQNRLVEVEVEEITTKSRLLGFLSMPPYEWFQYLGTMSYGDERLNERSKECPLLQPRACLFEGDDVYTEDGLSVDTNWNGLTIARIDTGKLKKCMRFDPAAAQQEWQINTIARIEAMIEKYKKCAGILSL